MKTQIQDIRDKEYINSTIADETAIFCKRCGNIYRNIWIKVGSGWNDFGFRYCPFCGTQTEEFAHIC